MTLFDVVEMLDILDDDLTIYVVGGIQCAPDSQAIVAREPEDGSLPPDATGMQYLLEVNLAKDVVEGWSKCRGGRYPTAMDKTEAILYYAIHDSYLPVE